MRRWHTDPADWDGTLPAVFALAGTEWEARRQALGQLAARALGHPVAVAHRDGRPPALLGAAGTTLHLSAAGRGDWAALALARGPVGVDIERVAPGAEIPWNVLHPAEAAALRGVDGASRDAAFARLWTLKEAYLKALGSGLDREPASFAVTLCDPTSSRIDDPLTGRAAVAGTAWPCPGEVVASVVLL